MKRNVPYRSNEQIWVEVERFRVQEAVSEYLPVPVDVMAIADLALRINITTFPGLLLKYRLEAAVTPDLQDIFVDEASFAAYEKKDPRTERRLRFSLAHEMCHWFLHREEILASQFSSIDDFISWMGDRSNPNSAEYQADEFAGRLLVPRESLLHWYDHFYRVAAANQAQWCSQPGSRRALAEMIAPKFGVNLQVIETRFDREGIWPAE